MKKDKLMKFFKADLWKNTVCLFFLAVIICSMMFSLINPFVDSLMPLKTITLTVNATDRMSNEILIRAIPAKNANNLFC